MANNLLQQAQQLKSLIEACKQQTLQSKEQAFVALKAQMEKEKTEVLQFRFISHGFRIMCLFAVSLWSYFTSYLLYRL